MKWGRRGDSHSRGANRPAVYETAAVAAEPRRHEMACRAVASQGKARLRTCMLRRGSLRHPLRRWRRLVGRLGFAPSSRRLRAGTSLSKFATRNPFVGWKFFQTITGAVIKPILEF